MAIRDTLRNKSKTPPKQAAPAAPVPGQQCQAEPFEETLAAFRKRVILKGGNVEEHYAIRKIEQLEEELKATRPKRKKKPWIIPDRLPHGSVFHVTYDANLKMWDGTLTADGITWRGTYSAVFKLLRALDAMYRASIKNPVDKPPAEA